MDNENNNNNNNVKRCSGDCMQCSFQQRVYCAAQIARNNVDEIAEIKGMLSAMAERVDRLGNASTEVFNPMGESTDTAVETVEEVITEQFDNAQ